MKKHLMAFAALALTGCGLLDSNESKQSSAIRTHEGYVADLDTVGYSRLNGDERYHLAVPVDTAGLSVPSTSCNAFATLAMGRDALQDSSIAVGTNIHVPSHLQNGRTYVYYRYRLDCTEAIALRDTAK